MKPEHARRVKNVFAATVIGATMSGCRNLKPSTTTDALFATEPVPTLPPPVIKEIRSCPEYIEAHPWKEYPDETGIVFPLRKGEVVFHLEKTMSGKQIASWFAMNEGRTLTHYDNYEGEDHPPDVIVFPNLLALELKVCGEEIFYRQNLTYPSTQI